MDALCGQARHRLAGRHDRSRPAGHVAGRPRRRFRRRACEVHGGVGRVKTPPARPRPGECGGAARPAWRGILPRRGGGAMKDDARLLGARACLHPAPAAAFLVVADALARDRLAALDEGAASAAVARQAAAHGRVAGEVAGQDRIADAIARRRLWKALGQCSARHSHEEDDCGKKCGPDSHGKARSCARCPIETGVRAHWQRGVRRRVKFARASVPVGTRGHRRDRG